MNMNDLDSDIESDLAIKALARSHIYAALAQGFSLPEKGMYELMRVGVYMDNLASALDACAPDLLGYFEQEIAPDLQIDVSYQDFESAYFSAFETNLPDPSVSLYEGSYLKSGGRPLLLLELKGFFSNFGLEMGKHANDFEDTLPAELEFMQFLTAKQAQAEGGAIELAPYLKAQKDFLERHLEVWLPALCAEIEKSVKPAYYRALAKFMAEFVRRDIEEVRRDVARHEL